MAWAELLVGVEQPFPGLRPFQTNESLLFFGREQHVDELLRRLAESPFLAIVGTSGSGKSSLVRAGLLPALYRGYLVGSTTRWRIAVMRPGNAPLDNLEGALLSPDALGPDNDGCRRALLSSSSLGLINVVRAAGMQRGESLLIVADQFEELFRYRQNSNDDEVSGATALFVSQLLQAVERSDTSVYVVVTMRSDFLGDCTQFPGLAEMLSHSQYLIPRLSREQRQQAIERPLHLADLGVTKRLIEQLLNDSGYDAPAMASTLRTEQGGSPDPLPVLQHALMRTFNNWKQAGATGDLDLQHYNEAGRIQDALNDHAEYLFQSLDTSHQRWAGKVFRVLTGTELGRPVRRPTRLTLIYDIVGAEDGADRQAVDHVLTHFLHRHNSLLISSSFDGLRPDDVIDISHESLIWKWKRLQEWVKQEASSAEWYLDLVQDVKRGDSALWRAPNLTTALRLRKAEGWNEHWAAQYFRDPLPTFETTITFLEDSRRAAFRERVVRLFGAALVLIAIWSALLLYRNGRRAAETNRLLETQVARVTTERRAVDAIVLKLQSDLITLRSSRRDVTPDKMAEHDNDIQNIQNKLALAEQERSKLQLQQDVAAQQLKAGSADLPSLNRALSDRIAQLTASNATANTQIKHLQEDLTSANTELQRVTIANATANLQITHLQEDLTSAKAELERLKRHLTTSTAPVPAPPPVSYQPRSGYVQLPAGTFRRPCFSPEPCNDPSAGHSFSVPYAFYITENEITAGDYRKFASGAMPGSTPFNRDWLDGGKPMNNVNWYEALSFCASSMGGTLPSEVELEYALSLKRLKSLVSLDKRFYEWTRDWYNRSYYSTESQSIGGPHEGRVRLTIHGVSGRGLGGTLIRDSFAPDKRSEVSTFRCVVPMAFEKDR